MNSAHVGTRRSVLQVHPSVPAKTLKEFIALARAVYKTTDERAAIKRTINMANGSAIVEEKSYRDYS